MMHDEYDVLIVGGGVVGSAVARELARYRLRIAVLEKEPDILCETSARNSGVLHAGFNSTAGTKMARFCVEGNRGFDALARELDVPYRRTGKLVIGFSAEDRKRLEALRENGEKAGVPGLEIIDATRIRQLAPLVRGAFALWSPTTAILSPFQLTLGLAENAVRNGVRYVLKAEVGGIRCVQERYIATTAAGEFRGRWIINCAGLHADRIARLQGIDSYTIHPCRGEYFVLDQRAGPMLPLPVYPVPDPKSGGLGIHLTPSVDGNVFIGPSNEYIGDTGDYAVTKPVMEMLVADAARVLPELDRSYFIRNYAGIRPKLTGPGEGGYHDFVIERRRETPRAIHLIGIESPGLTCAIPIAREVVRQMWEVEQLAENPYFDPVRRGIVRFADQSIADQAALIAQDRNYGEIICRCGAITKAEVLAAIRNPLGVHTMTGIKYRCRAMMGRCQSGYCQTRIAELILQETGKRPEDLEYARKGSYLFTGAVRDA